MTEEEKQTPVTMAPNDSKELTRVLGLANNARGEVIESVTVLELFMVNPSLLQPTAMMSVLYALRRAKTNLDEAVKNEIPF